MLYLPTTREGYMYLFGWYVYRVRVTGEIELPNKEQGKFEKYGNLNEKVGGI